MEENMRVRNGLFYKISLLLALLACFFGTQKLLAAMTGGSYDIFSDTFSAIEDPNEATGGSYTLRGSGGEFGAANISGGTYELRGGFQAMEKGSLTLELTTTSVSLGTLALTTVASSTVTSTISTDSATGYSLTFDENDDLKSGLNTINDVADGTVTAGSEEYGVVTSGGGGVLVADTAIADGLEIASSLSPVVNQQTGIIFKAAIGGSTLAGSYSHTITATLTVNP